METFDLTPDPKVLIALTHTPMQPLDALCELIDNAIDSFQAAELQGTPVEHPIITIDLPRMAEITRGAGIIRVRDNGIGLTRDMAEKAIKAGFSGNNPYDSLGLFGMGFNISTGKMGRRTKFFTARRDEETAIEVIVDLEEIQRRGSYSVPFVRREKPQGFEQGTEVEISGWWPEGNANSDFVKKLVQYGMPVVRREIGRRYATVLKNRNIRIVINGEHCEPYEHCIWDDSRYVERRNHGQIPAVFRFDEVIGTQKRCGSCTALVPQGQGNCPACGSGSLRTIEERIRGWVGIQRFDHDTEFGIDLIRNGRAIRIGEKAAFFEYVDEFKKVIKDYPIDQQYGRIVGEVHLNHVPVDFLKQDFQRSSPEWQRAMTFLRGDSSLQPNQPGADQNNSPIFKLYQGYRRVRTPGRTDLYMGYWDPEKGKPERISRNVEREYYEKFRQKEPGYYDDTEWWKLVEQADSPPAEELVECPECNAQNLQGHEICAICGHVLIGKSCINPECTKTIPRSAQSCPYCGISQIAEIQEPWTCQVCKTRNSASRDSCESCGQLRGTVNTLSRDYLLGHAHKSDDLSIPGCSVLLADGTHSAAIDVDVYVTEGPIRHNLDQSNPLPLISFRGQNIEIFIDKAHRLFKNFGVKPEQMIAAEIALYIYDFNRRLSGNERHSLANLEWNILNSRWAEKLEDAPEHVREDAVAFLDIVRQRLSGLLGEQVQDVFENLHDEEKKQMIENMLVQGEDISKLGEMSQTGKYLLFVDELTILKVFQKYTPLFFDGKFWDVAYSSIHDLSPQLLEQLQKRIRATYLNCLEDIVAFLKYRSKETIITRRARMSLEFLQQKVVQT